MAEIDLDKLAKERVGPKLLALEPDLYGSKWFDYRHLHFVTSSGIFMAEYSRIFKQFSQIRIDIEEGKLRTGFKWGKSLFDLDKGTITGIWKARQHCDRRGMPYGTFCGIALGIATKCGWEFLPRPQHLSGEDLIERVEMEWQELLMYAPPLSIDDRFLVREFKGEPDQLAYREYLYGLIKGRHHPEYMLASQIVKGYLDLDFAAARFDADTVDLAKRLLPELASQL